MINFFQKVLKKHAHIPPHDLSYTSVGGGCINNAAALTCGDRSFFIKWSSHGLDMFEKEATGLELLHNTKTLKVPQIFGYGSENGTAYLLLELIKKGHRGNQFWKDLGRQLAHLHQNSHHMYGLDHDNYIGRLPQRNTLTDSWTGFFRDHRLEPQISIATRNGLLAQQDISNFEALYQHLNQIFPEESPSLLHGDLWSGNILCAYDGSACIFDPAVHFGHREMELAFTKLFGGFDPIFYATYEETFPLTPGFNSRVDVYNLYPLLVHLNLFGSSYLSSIRSILKKYS